MDRPSSLFDKLWQSHVVHQDVDGTTLLYIDRHLVYEVTSPQAFEGLRLNGRSPRRPETVIATVDHNVPTTTEERHSTDSIPDILSRQQVKQLEKNCKEFNINFFGLGSRNQGISHVIGPELGGTLPGMTVVAGDSHTSTHGAFGALAFGVGTSDVEHVLAAQCLAMKPMKQMLVKIEGTLPFNTSAKDLILTVIQRLGAGGGAGYAIEFDGPAIRQLSMEGRMTICNMAIEAGARVGLVSVDEKTIDYLRNRPYAPQKRYWNAAVTRWQSLVSDPEAHFDKTLVIEASTIRPMVTWGTSPDMVSSVDDVVPDPDDEVNPVKREGMRRALEYMKLLPGTPIRSIQIDKVFIGSCTNSRIEDLRAAAAIVAGKSVSPTVRQALVVPGSGLVKEQAEAEGLDLIFKKSGFEWREPGCSMCLGMNDDRLAPGERCASTSNRNFEGRQGTGGLSHLVSPTTAAATAIAGHFTDIH
ncbi:3-isopropylmalate dehydratase large subunit [Advenella sp. FME57]|uniref:3-isopropylmalate dehydratase large subunit n=1 Tax=Advenella sp. FME57 TaxID=2742604 RepID=UPI001867AE3A|nr:3-isopropylmalate dehydratase large subunit [Advenella sp. FME57]